MRILFKNHLLNVFFYIFVKYNPIYSLRINVKLYYLTGLNPLSLKLTKFA